MAWTITRHPYLNTFLCFTCILYTLFKNRVLNAWCHDLANPSQMRKAQALTDAPAKQTACHPKQA